MAETIRRARPAASRARAAAQEAVGKRTTHVSKGKQDEEVENEVVSRKRFNSSQEPAFVRVTAGGTYNLGNYESMRIDVSVTLPCDPNDIEQCYQEASEFVSEKLSHEEGLWFGKGHKR